MPLRNVMTVPPGGWLLRQKLPGGAERKFASMGLAWSLAEEIADFRKGNGLERATAREALEDIETQTCERLHDDPQFCVGDKKKEPRRALRRFAGNAARVADGARVLIEWLGDGAKPVSIEVAQRRANVCLGCDENREGHALLRLTGDAVRAIAEQMQARTGLRRHLQGEERLHTCRVCACPLRLKLDVPLATILEHTDAETMGAFPAHCWVLTEQRTQL